MGPKACSLETLTTWEGRPGWAVIVLFSVLQPCELTSVVFTAP
jgi:hypothetical protein